MRILIDETHSDEGMSRFTVAEVSDNKIQNLGEYDKRGYHVVDIPEWWEHEAVTHFGSTIEICLSDADKELFAKVAEPTVTDPLILEHEYNALMPICGLHLSLCAMFGCAAVFERYR